MIVFLSGQFIPEEQALVSVFDRGFLYGDGLFETIRVFNGKPFRWQQHLDRLERGANFLKIRLPFPPHALYDFAAELIRRNQAPDSLLRLTLSRGIGERGYSPKGSERPSVAMSLHPSPAIDPLQPPRWRLATSSVRLPVGEPLSQFKTSNKLRQILARAEADAVGADEALLLNRNAHVAEGTSSNLFWIQRDTVCTPPLDAGILPGITRAVVLKICRDLQLPVRETNISLEDLRRASGVFFSLSSIGIAEAVSLDGVMVPQSQLFAAIHTAYRSLLCSETA